MLMKQSCLKMKQALDQEEKAVNILGVGRLSLPSTKAEIVKKITFVS